MGTGTTKYQRRKVRLQFQKQDQEMDTKKLTVSSFKTYIAQVRFI